jgi:hypothetical protein
MLLYSNTYVNPNLAVETWPFIGCMLTRLTTNVNLNFSYFLTLTREMLLVFRPEAILFSLPSFVCVSYSLCLHLSLCFLFSRGLAKLILPI